MTSATFYPETEKTPSFRETRTSLIYLVITSVLTGPQFFYPSTEWHMAQPFDCFCGTPSCRGRIAGARDMPRAQLEGLWLNGHIRELLDERDSGRSGNDDPTTQALRDALKAAERVVEAARSALRTYTESSSAGGNNAPQQAQATKNGVNGSKANGSRNGASARELGGELGGDTTA